MTGDYEIIFVNDGSPDDSLARALVLHDKDNKVKIADLSRNFGHHSAAMTGLAFSQGDFVFMIDSDLEESPELLAEYWEVLMISKDVDVVYGVQKERRGGLLDKLGGEAFYFLNNLLSNDFMPRNMAFSRLMTRRYVKSLLEYKEREICLAGLWYITGYKQVGVNIKKTYKGKSTYTLAKKITLLTNHVVSFSDKPLIFIFYTGLFIFCISTAVALSIILRKLFFSFVVTGWTSIIVTLWLLGGLIILFLGVIAIYLSKIFIETKNRPITIVRHFYSKA